MKKSNNFEQLLHVVTPPVSLSNCSPNDITGIADAKNIYVVGARILKTLN